MKTLKGLSIIELVFAGAIFVIFSAVFVEFFLQSLSNDQRNAELSAATAYAQEGMEIVQAMSREGFPSLELVTDGGVESNGQNGWRFHGGGDSFGKYERQITTEYAHRDNGDISENGATDEKTIRVISTVRWESIQGREESILINRYITYWDEPF
jgi:type II secretory pathway pseudopilin PulG